jgi:chloramphenicol 3-O phosphotransferase
VRNAGCAARHGRFKSHFILRRGLRDSPRPCCGRDVTGTPVILLNGASSSGKTTLARALQHTLEAPFLHFSSDQLVAAGVLPEVDRTATTGPWAWQTIRPRFFDGFHRATAALAAAGNSLIVEHVIELRSWYDDLLELLADYDVFYVGVECPLPELERRERARGDRFIGEGRSHLEDGVHTWGPYDIRIDTSVSTAEDSARRIQRAFHERKPPSAFQSALAGRRS